MTTSDFRKVLKQLKVKPAIYRKYIKHNAPKERSCGINNFPCQRCGRKGGHVGKYKLDLCRQCFREVATKIGFKQYN